MEKVWAYMKINDLLKNTAITDDVETKAILKKRTLALSLKYNFVTPLTSMVVSESFSCYFFLYFVFITFGNPDK
jgi:hypothetical protein